jgi:hypothetical protein
MNSTIPSLRIRKSKTLYQYSAVYTYNLHYILYFTSIELRSTEKGVNKFSWQFANHVKHSYSQFGFRIQKTHDEFEAVTLTLKKY